MSLKITHKYSTAAGTPPASGDIDVGEVAINAADAELYTKDNAGNIKKFANTDTTGTAAGVQFTQAGTGAVQRSVESKLQDVVSVKDFGAVGDGVADDTAAIQAAINYCRTFRTTCLFPGGTFQISSSIDISGVEVRGVGTGYQNNAGTIIKGSGSHILLEQKQTSASLIKHSISGLRLSGGTVGLKLTYSVGSLIDDISIVNCTDGILCGVAGIYGPLWNTFRRCFVDVTGTALNLDGDNVANANLFDTCTFKGGVAGASVTCQGGLGAISNQFLNTEFFGDGNGIVLGRTKSTSFENCYFESKKPSVKITDYSVGTQITGCTFGSVRNDNLDGVPAFIWHSANTCKLTVSGGYIYLPAGSEYNNLRLFYSDAPNIFIVEMFDAPSREISATGFKLFNTGLPNALSTLVYSDTYTPVWTTSGTAPALGNGTLTGRYTLSGSLCTVQLELVAGSTTTFGSGQFQISLPFAVANAARRAHGAGRVFDSGTGQYVITAEVSANSTQAVFYTSASPSQLVSSTQPMAWGSGDALRLTLTYPVR